MQLYNSAGANSRRFFRALLRNRASIQIFSKNRANHSYRGLREYAKRDRTTHVDSAPRCHSPDSIEAHRAARTTMLTPTAVKAVPTRVISVIGSPNSSQAISAVVGGTRYSRLVTLVAAPR